MVSAEASILMQNFGTLGEILESISIILGLSITLGGIFQFKKYGETRTMMSAQHSAAGPLAMVIAGGALLTLPSFIGSALLTFWGNNISPLNYSDSIGGYAALLPAILMFVRLIGVGSFIRGLVLLSRAGGHQAQPGTLAKAIIHIVGGILCLHVGATLNLLADILGMSSG